MALIRMCDVCKKKEVTKVREYKSPRKPGLVEIDVCNSCVVEVSHRIQKVLALMGKPDALTTDMVNTFLLFEIERSGKK